jgi:hypothetical protein
VWKEKAWNVFGKFISISRDTRDISSRSKCADECLKEKKTETGITNVNYQDNYDEITQTRINDRNVVKYSCFCIAAFAGQIDSSIPQPKYHDTCVLKTTEKDERTAERFEETLRMLSSDESSEEKDDETNDEASPYLLKESGKDERTEDSEIKREEKDDETNDEDEEEEFEDNMFEEWA